MGIYMPKPIPISLLAVAIASSWLTCIAATAPPQTAASESLTRSQDPKALSSTAPSREEISVRFKNLIANQHKDDLAQEQYEWIERHITQAGGASPRTVDDKTIRLVSNGAGTTKLILAENGKPTDPAESRRQLQNLVQVLQMMLNPNDPRMKAASAKYQKRMREHSDLVDIIGDAFTISWLGRESRSGHDCDVIQANPNPDFHPHSIFQDALAHVSAKVWVDHAGDQIVHADAKILSDIPFGGGFVGKLYRGGTVTLDQAEVAPGIWFTTHEQYDFSGRKFLFPFEEHEIIEFSQFRFVGPPKDALAMVQAELANSKPLSGDP